MFPGRGGGPGAGGFGGGIDCCLDKDDPTKNVHTGWDELDMNVDDIKGLTLEGADPLCTGDNYTWEISPDQGSLDVTDPFAPIFTAPAGGEACLPDQTIKLFCNGSLIETIGFIINPSPATASIGYTTQQMSTNGTQTLVANRGAAGCGTPDCTWAITAGGGSLSSDTGDSIIYTAPATNPLCANNPTIALSCGGVVLDTLHIAVNSDTLWAPAYSRCCDFMQAQYHQSCLASYTCLGAYYGVQYYPLCETTFCGFKSMFYDNPCAHPGYYDLRTQTQKNAGCCPAQLI